MYTSCGWFFDDVSGLEAVQVLQYAGRSLQLGQELFGHDFEGPFLERLAKAKSNVAEHGDGLPVGADGDAIASGVFPFGRQPVAWLQPEPNWRICARRRPHAQSG